MVTCLPCFVTGMYVLTVVDDGIFEDAIDQVISGMLLLSTP